MAEPFLGEIRLLSFQFAPKGWALCNGQLLPVNQNQGLFSLLGTTYGGDGRVNFGLPNLQGRVPIHMGNGHTLGERGGEQAHTLSISEVPTHVHALNATNNNGVVNNPNNNFIGAVNNMFTQSGSAVAFDPTSVATVGGSQAHVNMEPFLVLNFSIALQGIFPSQT
jgi:microcystin-dependent protein